VDQIGLICHLGLKEFDHKIEDAQNMLSKNTHHIGHLVHLNLFAALNSLHQSNVHHFTLKSSSHYLNKNKCHLLTSTLMEISPLLVCHQLLVIELISFNIGLG
jgi:hypothetical protein